MRIFKVKKKSIFMFFFLLSTLCVRHLQKRKVMEKKTYLWNIIKNLPINCFASLKAFYSLGKIYLNLTK